MPDFALRAVPATMPVVGLIATGAQVSALSGKLAGRTRLMLVAGDDWLAAFSSGEEVSLPWLPDRPIYLYALASVLLCQTGFEPDLPAPLLPALAGRLASTGTVALTEGPTLWDFSAARPAERCNLRALV